MCLNIFIWKWPQLRLLNLLSNHGDLLEGIGVFLSISGICQTFDEGLEVQLACRQYSLHLKPKALRHQHYMEDFPVKGKVGMLFLVKNRSICTKIAVSWHHAFWFFPPSITILGSTTLPKDLLIFNPLSSSTNPCVITPR